MKNWQIYGLLTIIFLIALFYRLYGLSANIPFWVDEFYTASQANVLLKHGLSAFFRPDVYVEYHNILPHFLVALFFKLFGQREWVARIPFVIIGSLVPIAVFFLARKIFNTATAISASLLTTFSYLQITWSRQARGYVLQQLLVLLTFYFYLEIISKKKNLFVICCLLFVILLLGILTHVTFYLLILALLIHFLTYRFNQVIGYLRKPFIYSIFLFLLLLAAATGTLKSLINFYNVGALITNNLWYYHSFFWREYGLITFLAITGLIIAFIKKPKTISLLFIYLFIYLFFINFIFKPYISRYLVVTFPLLYIFMANSLNHFSCFVYEQLRLFHDRNKVVIPLFLTLFIIANGYKFVNKPKKYYSVNHDFREIANIDYHQVYRLVEQKIKKNQQPAVIIETLPDRTGWYLTYDYQPMYLLRWGNESGFVNGLSKQTPSEINKNGEKVVAGTSLKLISELSDLKKVMTRYPKGFIFIDDWSMPQKIIEYAKKNFKEELYLDHYSLDDNPYSIWPAKLYSWGIK